MARPKITVAKYLEQQLALCGKSQREIATEIGYTNPNIITMFKTGVAKIPLKKVGSLAKALAVDPAYMLRLVMGEYMPETWDAIEAILGRGYLMTDQDRAVANLVREAAGNQPFDLNIEENRKALAEAIKSVVTRDKAKADAAVKRVSALPSNSRRK